MTNSKPEKSSWMSKKKSEQFQLLKKPGLEYPCILCVHSVNSPSVNTRQSQSKITDCKLGVGVGVFKIIVCSFQEERKKKQFIQTE